MLDNVSVAILNMVNDLVSRHGFEPWDLVVVTQDTERETELRFETPPPKKKERAFSRMLDDLRVTYDGDMPVLHGSDQKIISALQTALAKAPRQRSRL